MLVNLMKEQLKKADRIHVVMEQFTFEMQYLLDDLTKGILSIQQVQQAYKEIKGDSQCDITPYLVILEKAQKHPDR